MLSAFEYFERIANPTAQEFIADNRNVRRAMLACMSTLHVVDYVFQNRCEDAIVANKEVERYCDVSSTSCFSFKVVRGFALASKHCRLVSQQFGHVISKNYRVTYPSFAGVARAGATFVGDKTVGIAVRWKKHRFVNLSQAIQGAHKFLISDLPELKDNRAVSDE